MLLNWRRPPHVESMQGRPGLPRVNLHFLMSKVVLELPDEEGAVVGRWRGALERAGADLGRC